jgi:pantoate--beta-alanine ligase
MRERSMKIFSRVDDLKQELARRSTKGMTIGLVPTMGFLHEGHLELVRRARRENLITIVSIFVNPMQFGVNEDFDQYPRDIQRDETLLQEERIDYLFCPTPQEIYPDGFCTTISLSRLTPMLCGGRRQGHFDGVATVVAKLLSIATPTTAYFGLKDYQQFLVIRQLVKDLNMSCNIVGVPIVREQDGLAMSSRNVYLRGEERIAALSLSASFTFIQRLKDEGRSVGTIIDEVQRFISAHEGNRIDYVELVNPETLLPVATTSEPFICMLAVFVGQTRLIDNMLFE